MSASEVIAVFIECSHSSSTIDAVCEPGTDEPIALPAKIAGSRGERNFVVEIFLFPRGIIRLCVVDTEIVLIVQCRYFNTDAIFMLIPSVCPCDSTRVPTVEILVLFEKARRYFFHTICLCFCSIVPSAHKFFTEIIRE